jgi:glyoxylase-like metal-dependent hydrolase (beta-lactamase superfamily II)
VPIHTPGHTPGHVAYHFPRHRAVFAGDALCTWHPTRGRRGPQVMAFNVSTPTAYQSLDAIEHIDADLLLVGHGDPWRGSLAQAVERARATARDDSRV